MPLKAAHHRPHATRQAPPDRQRVGLVSDTHGLLRPEILAFLAASDHIIHAGDICEPAILETLAAIAPVTAVRGNNDHGAWAARLPEVACIAPGGVGVAIIHDLHALKQHRLEDHIRVVICGHSHRPLVENRDGRLLVNPGSAGPRRFRLPIAAAELVIEGGRFSAHIREFG